MTPVARARGALLALVLVVEGILAAPIPHSMKRSSLDEPIAREEIAAQVRILDGLGISVTTDQLADALYRSGAAWASAYHAVIDPVEPLLRVTGTGQGWGLFTYPDTYPHQLVVDVRRSRSGPFVTLYAGLDPEHAWKRDILAYRRVRGVYDGQTAKPGASWNNLTKWLAGEACAEDPLVSAVRVSFTRFHTVRPDQPAPAPGDPLRHARTWSCSQVKR